ncbi:MAG: oligosaccharide flippase family protein [gamma proteobacterium symbiont of Bathyaustriella thionipta]|nr:oligosaccharide flippase family protein [gamma proteobacterium symbiont of Bathyaustriella thionipta]MCU7948704.1 oligosaccharide flippase family protein [gamma proteobacterium symbiont of Bathyaustriella thionipta]MCU7953881.1 oligosaccharide flippase family protein [gamma proteobacterium symbiont of Bathyaustriella thionipta]MCU7955023.1 oligosaccharide flippase family protein [gamma proteobacterium symbiont of Bathyaustriella thionipta]MCU7968643.1 oligosaccharide flippase family protein 
MVKEFINRYLPEGSSIRHVSALISGAAIGQLAVFLILPLLTRLYTPEEFGVLAVFASILGIMGPVSGFRYELAIPLVRTDSGAANIAVTAVICVLSSMILISFFIMFFGKQIPLWVRTPSVEPYLWLLPLGVGLTGLYQVFNYWAIRRSNFNCIARTKIQQGVGTAIAQMGLGFTSFGPLGLIVGHIIGQSSGLFALILGAYHDIVKLKSRICWRRFIYFTWRYRRFPQYTTWAALANSASTMLPLMLFAVLFSTEVAGAYLLAQRFIQVPLNLISNAVGQVFHAKAAKLKYTEELEHLVVNTFSKLFRLLVVPLIIIGYFAPEIFMYIFGENWRSAGVYAQLMVPWLILQVCVSSISQVVTILEKQAGLFVSQLVFLIFRVSVFMVAGFLEFGATATVASFTLVSALLYIGHFLWICTLLNVSLKSFWKIFMAGFLKNRG